MLDKILSNLQFDADSRHQLREFIGVIAKERLARGFGVVVIIMALLLQVVAVSTPSKSSAAASPNDLIPGGVSSQQQLVNDCNSDYHYTGLIYGWYGATCQNIAAGTVVSLNSTSYNGSLYSVGHLPYGLPGETPVTVWGATLYWRPLHAWDTHGSSTYTALRFTNSQGLTYFILFGCGNLVSIGFPTPAPGPNLPTPAPAPTPAPTPTPAPAPTPAPTPKPTACQYNSLLPQSSPICKPCPASTGIEDETSCLTYAKTAANLTQNISNANNTTANASDNISYTLTVTNTGKATQPDFIIQDSVSDILEYANVVNLNGGKIDSNGFISWPATTIAAGATVQRTFEVQVKNPVPDTAPALDDPQGYNDTMTNTYGNTISIKVRPTAVQATIQTAATTLPNTGPGSSIIIFGVIAVIAGYFYSNRRLQTKEAKIALDIVKQGEV